MLARVNCGCGRDPNVLSHTYVVTYTSIHRLTRVEQLVGNPVARMIVALDLEASRATLLLDNWAWEESDSESDGDEANDDEANGDEASDDEDTAAASKAAGADSEEGGGKVAKGAGKKGRDKRRIKVDIDLNVNAFTNAKCASRPRNSTLVCISDVAPPTPSAHPVPESAVLELQVETATLVCHSDVAICTFEQMKSLTDIVRGLSRLHLGTVRTLSLTRH